MIKKISYLLFNIFKYCFLRNSQFQDEYTLEQIQHSPHIFGPLTKLQCCPTSDGSAAVVLVSEQFLQAHPSLQSHAVEILGMEMATDTHSTFQDQDPMKLVNII